jgi:signal transduction histidine kinase
LRDSAMLMNSTLNFGQVVEQILANIGRVVPHDAVSLLLLDGELARVVRTRGYAKAGLPQLKAALDQFSVNLKDADLLRTMALNRQPLRLADWCERGSWAALPEINAIRSFLGMPIRTRDDVLGFLVLHGLTSGFFTSQHSELLEAFAAHAGMAIQNALAHEQAQTSAVLEERQRLARDLHDAVSQSLFSANIITETMPRLWADMPDKMKRQLDLLHRLTRGALAEMRTMLLELRPEQLLNTTLPAHLRQLADAARWRRHMEINLSIQEVPPLPAPVQIALYRIAQEAVNNVVKHTRATCLDITLKNEPDRIHLVISDDGEGFDPALAYAGIGLHSMRERAEAIQASFIINTAPDKGTQIAVSWEKEKVQDDPAKDHTSRGS